MRRVTKMMNINAAKEFASRWLPAWTGNKPEELASYYSEDCFYMDAGIPNGVNGKNELIEYFRKLLAQNPDWVWTQIEAIPMEGGFLNKWIARIPVGNTVIECIGVCFLQFDDKGKIKRNEVFFDRTELVSEIYKLRRQK
jgi:SnoaL-like protein